MSRLNTMLIREEQSRRMVPGSVRMIYILRGHHKQGCYSILDWMENFKDIKFYGKGLRDLNKMLFVDKPWEVINEQIRLGNPVQ